MTTRTKFDVWSGRLGDANAVQPYCGPTVLRVDEHSSLVAHAGPIPKYVGGRLTEAVLETASQPWTRMVYLWIFGSSCGRLQGVAEQFAELRVARDHAAIIGYVSGECYGLGLALALGCDLLFASPTAMIGHLACRSREGDVEPEVTAELFAMLAMRRPELTSRFDALAFSAINGEQGEAIGLVDSLQSSFDDLIK